MSDDKKLNHSSPSYSSLPTYYKISRNVLPQEEANQLSGYQETEVNCLNSTKTSIKSIKCKTIVTSVLPVTEWLPKYSVKKSFIGDLTAGITVAVMHIPQGMAYGLLAGVSPSVGLYMAFFPTLIYFLMGTSRHVSTGTFAVVSLMVSKIVQLHSTTTGGTILNNSTDIPLNLTLINETDIVAIQYTPIQVVTAVTFVVGILHILMCLLRLGTLASLLSEPLVNGFTTAAAVHVLVSQMKDLFGIKIPRHKGVFKIIFTIQDVLLSIEFSNITTVLVSSIVIIFMIIMNEFVKPLLSKKCRLPIPSELIAVIGGTVASYFLELGPKNDMKLVGYIPVGLPLPEVPPMELLQLVVIDSIAIAVVSYSIMMSMALIFAKKHSYEVKANQELLAIGFSNIVGSFFSCIPLACSLSRSLIQEQTGGVTQIASVVSAGLILVVLLWIGPFFEYLPKCVLGGIIIVALKAMFMQAKELKRFFKEGIMEGLVWCVTFFCVVLIDIDIGLFLGMLVSVIALYLKGWKSHCCLLGEIPGTSVYVDLKHHKASIEIPNIKIFRYTGSVNFASRSAMKRSLYELINVTVTVIRRASINNGSTRTEGGPSETTGLQRMGVLIIDLSSVAHIDSAGVKILTEIQHEMKILGTLFLLATPSDRVFKSISRATLLGEGPFSIFPTIHDAVLYSQSKI